MEKIWSPDHKFWLPTYFIYDLRENRILNVTLHARKVIKKRNRTTKTSKATVVFGFVFCLVMVFFKVV